MPDAAWLELPPAERARALQARPVWQRAIVVAAGPAMNFLIAIVVFGGLAMAYGVDATPATVGSVQPGSAAAAAHIARGDRITMLGGRQVETFSDLANFTILRPGERVPVTLLREGRTIDLDLTIGAVKQKDRFGNESRIGRLGIVPGKPALRRVGLIEAPLAGLRSTADTLQNTTDHLWQVITGRRSVDELGGPLRIAKMSGETLSLGVPYLIWFIATISINLGFINLLPVPLLDGGHLFFYAIEAIRRRPVSPAIQEWAFRGGLAAILALMVMVTFNDLGAFGLWKSLLG